MVDLKHYILKGAITRGKFSCSLQRNADERIGDKIGEYMVLTLCNLSHNVVRSRRLIYFAGNFNVFFSQGKISLRLAGKIV